MSTNRQKTKSLWDRFVYRNFMVNNIEFLCRYKISMASISILLTEKNTSSPPGSPFNDIDSYASRKADGDGRTRNSCTSFMSGSGVRIFVAAS